MREQPESVQLVLEAPASELSAFGKSVSEEPDRDQPASEQSRPEEFGVEQLDFAQPG